MKILIAGESWVSSGAHYKGFNRFHTAFYEEGSEQLQSSLGRAGFDISYIPSHLVPERFPSTSNELNDFSVVVLSDIGSDSLLLSPDTYLRGQRRPDRLAVLRDWISDGGGLLMIGGYMSFSGINAAARYWATALAEALPVVMSHWDDRVETPDGCLPYQITDHPVTAALSPDWPLLLGYNQLQAKQSAITVLGIRDAPLLTLWSYGEGRSAAFASDCSPHWGSPEFISWEGYDRFWGQLVGWLGGK